MSCYPSTIDWGTFDWPNANDAQKANRDLAEEYAWEFYRRLTAYTIGGCPVEMRPAQFGHHRPLTWSPMWAYGALNPYIGDDGQWLNAACSCGGRYELKLPFTVAAIDSITIDGETLAPSAYRVDNGNVLVRQDGGTWPTHQDMSKPAGEDGTFVVSLLTGAVPGRLDNFAVGVIAREFLKAQTGEQGCRLPKGTTTVARGGVTVIIDPAIRRGMSTGIPEVDTIVRMRNPHAITQQSRVYSPDTINRASITTFRGGVVAPPSGMTAPGTLIPDPGNPGFYQEI